MRMDQPQGLPEVAEQFLQENEVVRAPCECCNRPFPPDVEIIGHYHGMFDVKYPLFRHKLKNGSWADEFLQRLEHSSGPMFFLGLRCEDGSTFEWTQEKIEERI